MLEGFVFLSGAFWTEWNFGGGLGRLLVRAHNRTGMCAGPMEARRCAVLSCNVSSLIYMHKPILCRDNHACEEAFDRLFDLSGRRHRPRFRIQYVSTGALHFLPSTGLGHT